MTDAEKDTVSTNDGYMEETKEHHKLTSGPEMIKPSGYTPTVCYLTMNSSKPLQLSPQSLAMDTSQDPRSSDTCVNTNYDEGGAGFNHTKTMHGAPNQVSSAPAVTHADGGEDPPNNPQGEEGNAGLFLLRCGLCGIKERDTLVLPCQHVMSCWDCAKPRSICAICGSIIGKKVRVFLDPATAKYRL